MTQKQNAFTLIELVIVIAIVTVISVVILPLLQTGFDAYFTERDLSDADWQGNLALERMTRDIRSIPATTVITTATSSQFTFVDSTNTAVSYTLSGTSLMRNGLTLANNVNAVTFAYYNSTGAVTAVIANIDYVNVTLNVLDNSTDLTLFSTMNLRNVMG